MSKDILLSNKMSLGAHVLEWKKEDFQKAFSDATRDIEDGKGGTKKVKIYNPDDIYRQVQDDKRSNK